MKCRQYIFLLTSDQLEQARAIQSIQAQWHRLLCRHCRQFTRNDRFLLKELAQQRETEMNALRPPDKF